MPELRVELIAVGDELLMGMTLDRNSQYIAGRLAASGLRLQRMVWAADRPDDLTEQLDRAWKHSDVVIVTGGLGPTHDDITRPVIAGFFGDSLKMRADLSTAIINRYAKRGMDPAPGWESMAAFPTAATPIPNNHGAAPGIHYKKGEQELYAVPGVPAEMRGMFEEYILPRIQRRRSGAYRFSVIKTFGIGESHLAELIGDPRKLEPATLAFLPSLDHGVTLRISSFNEDGALAREALLRAEEMVVGRVRNQIYAREDISLEEVVLGQLRQKQMKLSLAESCTGGMIASRLVNVAGSSDVFERGFVTYSDASKVDLLGVGGKTLAKFGAVSERTALEMAEGARKQSGSDIAVSVTGIAGPGGGSEEKEIGLTFFALADSKGSEVVKHQFAGNRDENRRRATFVALTILHKRLKS